MNISVPKKLRRLLPLTVERVIPSSVVDIGSYTIFPAGFHGTNPSIVKLGDSYLVCVRGVNYVFRKDNMTAVVFTAGSHYRTINKFFLIDRDLRLETHLPGLDGIFDDIEDIKLCAFDDRIIGVGTSIDATCGHGASTIALIEIRQDLKAGKKRTIKSPFGFKVEKNWAPFVLDGILHFVYSFSPLVILRYCIEREATTICTPHDTHFDAAKLNFLIGGSSAGLPVFGGYIFAAHRRRVSLPRVNRNYVNRLYQLDKSGLVHAVSRYFVIAENAVQFINGLEQDGDDLIISYGWRDQSAYLGRVPRLRLPLRVRPKRAG